MEVAERGSRSQYVGTNSVRGAAFRCICQSTQAFRSVWRCSLDSDTGIIRFESQDTHEHSAMLEPWDLRISQVSPGKFVGTVAAIRMPSMVVYEESWSQATAVRGSSPPGYVLFGTTFGQRRASAWCGSELGMETFGCGGPSSEISLVAPRKSQHVVVLVQPETLAQGLGEEWRDRLSSHRTLHAPPDAGCLFVRSARAAVRQHLKRPDLLSRSEHVRSLESELLEVLIRCTEPVDRTRPRSGSRRSRALRTALEVAASQHGRMTALELSLAVGVSQRTLEYAFRASLGTTPGRYLRTLRLEGAQRQLVAADPRTHEVWRIAYEWGFYHLGRFSARYREHFAELPSHTLRRRRSSVHPVLAALMEGEPA